MILLIIGIVVFLGALVGIFNNAHDPEDRTAGRVAGVIAVFVSVALVLLSSMTVVGTRNVGVVTTYGKPSGRTLGNGLHFKAPWQKVTDLDGTITTQKFTSAPSTHVSSDDAAAGQHHCIDIRISDGSTACVSVVIRSRIDKGHADDIYADYRNSELDINDNVNDALVRTQLTSALASVFTDFNPLLVPGSVEGSQSTEQSAPDLQQFSKDTKSKMEDLLVAQSNDGKPQVDITSITLSYIRLSDNTQTRLNQLQAEVAQTRIAKQKQATAQAQAKANELLSASISKAPNVLVSKCFDIVDDAVRTKVTLPAGFSCWQNGSGSLVIPAK